jgi:hypothetical protein
VVDAVFAFRAIAPSIVTGGLQAALNGLANVHVFPLNNVTEFASAVRSRVFSQCAW